MPEFYVIFSREIFPLFFFGGGSKCFPTAPMTPMPRPCILQCHHPLAFTFCETEIRAPPSFPPPIKFCWRHCRRPFDPPTVSVALSTFCLLLLLPHPPSVPISWPCIGCTRWTRRQKQLLADRSHPWQSDTTEIHQLTCLLVSSVWKCDVRNMTRQSLIGLV